MIFPDLHLHHLKNAIHFLHESGVENFCFLRLPIPFGFLGSDLQLQNYISYSLPLSNDLTLIQPENMRKCISNSNTFQGFWRAWHASFSEWLVRYIYVPMGGRKRRVISLWLIFFFVGAWHEFNVKWMAFAFFNAFGISLETIITNWVYRSGQTWISTSRSSWPIRLLEVLVAAMNLSLLILANFAINQGFDKTFSFFYSAFMKDASGSPIPIIISRNLFFSNDIFFFFFFFLFHKFFAPRLPLAAVYDVGDYPWNLFPFAPRSQRVLLAWTNVYC
jgi:hypothetical protein